MIAAGFDSGQLPYKKVEVRRADAEETRPAAPVRPAPASVPAAAPIPAPVTSNAPTHTWPLPSSSARMPVELDEELDVPDFLKN